MELDAILQMFRSALWSRRFLIVSVCLFATVTAVGMTYVIPEGYRASALVVVRPQEQVGLTQNPSTDKEVLDLPASGSNMQVETPSKTYIEVIKSRAVAERIVELLGLDRVQTQTPAELNWVARVKRSFKDLVLESRDILKYGRVIEVSPFEKAVQDVLENLSLTAVRNTFVFEIAYLAGEPRQAAAVANMAADVFLEYSSGAHENDATRNRTFLGEQLDATERNLAAARQVLRAFKEANRTASLEEQRSERIRSLGSLEVSLEETDAELSGLLRQFTTDNPKVQLLQGKKERLRTTIAAYRSDLEQFPAKEAQLAGHELQVKALENQYEQLRKEFEEARLRESRTPNELRVISAATPPLHPVKPVKIYYGSAAFFVGLLLAIGLALFLELTDARLKSIEDVERVLTLPVLATTPIMKR